MSRQANVPSFGNWDSNDDVAYTVVFNKARADRAPSGGGGGGGTGTGNKIINPNDPLEYTPAYAPPSDNYGAPPSRRPPPSLPRQHSTEELIGQQPPPAPPAFKGRHDHVNRPVSSFSPPSPKALPDDGGAAPYHAAPPAPKTRFRPEDSTPDRGAGALPKFGAWNDQDPNAGEGYTLIFSQARNEKKVGGPARIPALHQSSEPPTRAGNTNYGDANNQPAHTSWLPCCFQPRGAT